MNNSGKVITIFVVIIAILLISLTAISLFFFKQERERRQSMEDALGENRAQVASLQTQLDEAKKQKFLFEEKSKEMDERINSLLDDLELEQGLKEEMKKEQTALNEKLDKEIKAKEKLKEDLNKQIADATVKIKELEDKLRSEVETASQLKERNRLLEKENMQLSEGMGITNYVPAAALTDNEANKEMSLDEIVVKTDAENQAVSVPTKVPEGRIISVDDETEFVIVDLGKKHGVTLGRIMSIYRGDKYLGDIKITRVQPEMSAADLILPLTGKLVRKNDQVIAK
ncbi:MAG TPA: hypothetical protein VI749_00890 [Candidatus Omnitrophota bacterium]|nr:hypothetical protein [Candidatus Omnitrophota bacterium]